MIIFLPQRAKDCLDTARALLRAAHAMTDCAIAGQIKAHAEIYERQCAKLLRRDAAEAEPLSPK